MQTTALRTFIYSSFFILRSSFTFFILHYYFTHRALEAKVGRS
jgi:hypothetical protein